jgi:hypothetical protein
MTTTRRISRIIISIAVAIMEMNKATSSIAPVPLSQQHQFRPRNVACSCQTSSDTRFCWRIPWFGLRIPDMKREAWKSGKMACAAGAVFLFVSLSLFAPQSGRGDMLSALNSSLFRIPSLTLSDSQFFPFATAFNRMETTPADFLPSVSLPAPTVHRRIASRVSDPKDFSKDTESVSLTRKLLDNVHGEVGFLYGHSFGRSGGDLEAGYVVGDVGDDKFHITAGAAFENSNGHFRFSR